MSVGRRRSRRFAPDDKIETFYDAQYNLPDIASKLFPKMRLAKSISLMATRAGILAGFWLQQSTDLD